MLLVMKVAAICIVVSLVALLLERNTPELSLVLLLATVTAVMALAMSAGQDAMRLIRTILDRAGLNSAIFAPILKIVAISLITRLSGDVCRDGGKKSLASVIDLSGTICALAAAAPLLYQAMEVLTQWG